MAEKKSSSPKSGGGKFKEAVGGAAAYAAVNTLSDLVKAIMLDAGKAAGGKIIEDIKVRTLGLGPNDEALYNEVKVLLSGGVTSIKKLDVFVEEMKLRGFSFWWFRNVIATMHQNFKPQQGETKKDSPAVKIVETIISQSDWEDQARVAGSSLLVKLFTSRVNGLRETGGITEKAKEASISTADFAKKYWEKLNPDLPPEDQYPGAVKQIGKCFKKLFGR